MEKRPLYAAMRKYGIEAIEENIPDDKIDERENYWISFFKTYSNGYNATAGGDGKTFYDHNFFLQEFSKGKSITEIASEVGCDHTTVSKVIRAAGLRVRDNTPKQKGNRVSQIDPITKGVLNTFESQREAAQYMIDNGYSSAKKPTTVSTNIGRVIKGERKLCCGFLWELQ